MTFTPSPEQAEALDAIAAWHRSGGRRPFVLAGLAGTGKTSLLPLLPHLLGVPVRYVCPTWKAAAVLTGKLQAAGLPQVATSIHDLIYVIKGIKHQQGCAVWDRPPSTNSLIDEQDVWPDCDKGCADIAFEFIEKEPVPGIVVVDEASMVDEKIRADLALLGRPILYSGDHGQLPPIRGKSIFDEARGLRDEGRLFQLKQIQRQAEGSPIIRMAWSIRRGDGLWEQEMVKVPQFDLRAEAAGLAAGTTVLITYQNKTVDKANTAVRRVLGMEGDLCPGDIIVTRDNDKARQVYNGQVGEVLGFDGEQGRLLMADGRDVWARLRLVSSNARSVEWQRGWIRLNHGYGLTCHRAQGSEFPRVLVWLDSDRARTDRRWLYTAVTRARAEVVFR